MFNCLKINLFEAGDNTMLLLSILLKIETKPSAHPPISIQLKFRTCRLKNVTTVIILFIQMIRILPQSVSNLREKKILNRYAPSKKNRIQIRLSQIKSDPDPTFKKITEFGSNRKEKTDADPTRKKTVSGS